MHELSLAANMLDMVAAALAREGETHASLLRLEVGQLAGVELSALRFALESLSPGTCLEGCELVIDEPAGRGLCSACGATVALAHRTHACSACGGFHLTPTAGTELRIAELLVHSIPLQGAQPCA
jgi:hydrogenase nickel incorporation protein HypA/HybF